MALKLDFIAKTVEEINSGQFGFAYLVNSSGQYINHPDKDRVLNASVSQIRGLDDMLLQSSLGRAGFVEYENNGVERMAAYAPIPATGWTLVNTVSKEELYASAKYTRNIIIGSSVIFLVLALGAFFLLANGLAVPIMELAGAADKIAKGDLYALVKGESRPDEIGLLARAFNNMTTSLRESKLQTEKDDWLKTGVARPE